MIRSRIRGGWLSCLAVVLLVSAAGAEIATGPAIPRNVQAALRKYDSRYYVVFSDLPPEKMETVLLRLTCVAEMYNERTKGFAGKITAKLPVYMINDHKTYEAAGGLSLGVAYKDRLMIWSGSDRPREPWHSLQHEAFHQFANNVIGENLPPWVNEGMAEYLGEALWTGDGFVCGAVPENNLSTVRELIKQGQFIPFGKFIMTPQNDYRGSAIYGEGWAMTYFLVHAGNGKHRKALGNYMKMTAGGAPWDATFAKCFGKDVKALEKEYLDYWAADRQRDDDRANTEAAVATLASFLGRAWSQGQKFATFDEFLAAAKDGSLKKHPKQPLPDELLKENLDRAEKLKTWSLDAPEKVGLPKLVLALDDGTAFTATFRLKNNQVDEVKVDVNP